MTITPVLLNHAVVNFGYRIDCSSKSLFFTGDHENPYNIYDQEDDEFEMYQSLLDQKESYLLKQIQGVDVLIADSSYTVEEYPAKKGWGHGTYQSCMQLAEKAGAQQLFLTHHEPTRSDDALEAVFKESRNSYQAEVPEIALAREGLTIKW